MRESDKAPSITFTHFRERKYNDYFLNIKVFAIYLFAKIRTLQVATPSLRGYSRLSLSL